MAGNNQAYQVNLQLADEVLSQYHGRPGALIPVLQKVQAIYGWLPPQVIEYISQGLDVYLSEVLGVVTFYAQFYTTPRGKHTVRVCRGTACHVKGSRQVMDNIEMELKVKGGKMTEDGKFSLEEVNCIGACGIAPVIVIDTKTYGSLTVAAALEAVRSWK